MKKLMAFLLAAMLCFSLTACLEDEDWEESSTSADSRYHEKIAKAMEEGYGSQDDTWAVYWYLCGSDLESEYGMATGDLEEMLEAELSDNVTVVIQTGGADSWQNDMVDPNKTQRFVYNSQGLELVDEHPASNMGDPDTLSEFLSFCQQNYPADKTAVVFWNHGGGSVAGASFDENYGYDSLTLGEFYQAFNAVYELSTENPPFEVIGFDTCLMATIDTAYTFADIGRYLVASEEWEPGGGWYYSEWLQALADDPGMGGAQLGKEICDSYMNGCEINWVEDEVTLSVVDLSKIGPLMESYEAMGAKALECALEDPSFLSDFAYEASNSENYGGNTRDQGYANMVDLGHLAENCSEVLPDISQRVIRDLDNCVVYKVNGPYRENSTGLSCYYSYNGDLDDLNGYKREGCSDSFKYFYDYGLGGDISNEGMHYINSLGYEEDAIQEVPVLDSDYEYPLELSEDGYAVIHLDKTTMSMLKEVCFQLAYVDMEEDIILVLGRDNDIVGDWETGVFEDNFRGVWGALDDNLVYMEVDYSTEDYTVFTIPILLNGEEYNLRTSYDNNTEEYSILGARKGIDENGMSDKNLRPLVPGDEITTIHYATTISGDDDITEIPMDTFTVTENTRFHEAELGDGVFMMMFELIDSRNNSAFSEIAQLTVNGDNMDIEILSDGGFGGYTGGSYEKDNSDYADSSDVSDDTWMAYLEILDYCGDLMIEVGDSDLTDDDIPEEIMEATDVILELIELEREDFAEEDALEWIDLLTEYAGALEYLLGY